MKILTKFSGYFEAALMLNTLNTTSGSEIFLSFVALFITSDWFSVPTKAAAAAAAPGATGEAIVPSAFTFYSFSVVLFVISLEILKNWEI